MTNKLNKRGAKRLMNVVRALRESPNPDMFTMEIFLHPCGTPGCALGHYLCRTDLQKTFKVIDADNVRIATKNIESDFFHDVKEHFGLSHEWYGELFSETGCGNAKTAEEAAKYIQDFVMHTRPDGEHV